MTKAVVIGSGIAGVVAAAHLLKEGIEVTVFERSHAAGGVWLFDERVPREPDYSASKPSQGDNFVTSAYLSDQNPGKNIDDIDLLHAPPGPCYFGLSNNVGTRLLATKLGPFPEGTPDFVKHHVLCQYIQDTSEKSGVKAVTHFRTRVEDAKKVGQTWHVKTSTIQDPKAGQPSFVEEDWEFDTVIVASGHYHAPQLPNLPGLNVAKNLWPNRIFHSKQYRRPEGFKDKTVLLVGAGVSANDIAKEIGPFANKIYQTQRQGKFDLSARMLPANATRFGSISSINVPKGLDKDGPDVSISSEDALPVKIQLESGEILCNIDYIILCTGYLFALPFLKNLHNDDLAPQDADDEVLVTDGRQIHNLHKDIFYMPDPSLIFIGIPFFTATFSLFDFQAVAIAAFVAGKVPLPSQDAMRDEYRKRLEVKGYGKPFHSLRDQEEEYVIELLGWINPSIVALGQSAVQGHSQTWLEGKAEQRERIKLLLGLGSEDEVTVESPRVVPVCS
ncbi:dimethylaniline monooxygenase [Microthyrium microscopicum]|uniref:Dimethylaniline monooxygenase n=1 Tax=Microthyrium microscopicum TaxID=703497 RepID=A0A6A6UN02_9PEZI|nr:dimethylaniline monooxygenase [Microthyrium microscopicum]